MKKKRILLLGPMPPPSGGVSVHLQRLLEQSSKHSTLELAVFDIRRMRLFLQDGSSSNFFSMLIYFFWSDLVHIHWSHPMKIIAAGIGRITFKKILFTIHNPRAMNSWSTSTTMKLAYKTIFVFDPGKLPLDGIILPAFIRPEKNLPLPEKLTAELKEYVHVLVSLGSASKKINSGEDIYGFNIILEAIKAANLPSGVVLILVDINGSLKSKYRPSILEIEKEKNIRIIYWEEEINFFELLSKSSLFIRATRSDGDSISVREALSIGVPVLASDCVIRPAGCILFKDGNAVDLSQIFLEQLNYPKKLIVAQPDFVEVLFELYGNV